MSLLVTADWVVPVSGPPIENGAVRIAGTHVVEVGPAEELRRREPRVPQEHRLPGCVITPGLVNAHTHLSLSALEGLLPSAPFHEWVVMLATLIRDLGPSDMADSAALGALRCLRTGVTVVGDVAYGPEALAACDDAGVGGTFFWEVFGIPESRLEERLKDLEYPAGTAACGPRVACGLSAHSMYTSGPHLLTAVHRYARDTGRSDMLHVAESPAEMRLATLGEGPLKAVAGRLAFGLEAPRTSPVGYLDGLGVLTGTLAVHCAELAHGDEERLARSTRGVVLCPTSNAFLHSGPAPVERLRKAGARLAVGTDSLASAPGADVLGEVRRVGGLDAGMTRARLLRMATADGAEALGLGDRFGTLEAGKQADLVAFSLGAAGDPVAAVVDEGSSERIEAVMSGGSWRLLEGKESFSPRPVERRAAEVTARAASVLERLGWAPGQM